MKKRYLIWFVYTIKEPIDNKMLIKLSKFVVHFVIFIEAVLKNS
jgi:hypothetical protein